uniref:Non-structural protein NS-S n=1 Tax=Buttonwillow virus TaxID=159140 RepID=A0A346JET8_9VIRU|nr:NSs protein [Buttonwillow virus]
MSSSLMMYLNGLHLRLTRRQHMWHLKLSTEQASALVSLEFSSSTRRRPRIVYVRRHNQMSILLLASQSFQWLITIFHNSSQIRCQITVLPCTASPVTLRDG